MQSTIKNIFLCLFGVLISSYLLLVLIGGGFKDKFQANENIESDIFFAHRGVLDNAPENSTGAIEQALLKGFTAIEVDIMKTKDGELILFHDENGNRLLGVDIDIARTTYEDIKKYSLQSSQYKVISLEYLFKHYTSQFIFYLDFKNEADFDLETYDTINHLIKKYKLENKTLIAGSNLFFTGYIEFKFPHLLTVLEGFDTNKEWIYSITPSSFRPDFVAGFYKKVDISHIEKLKEKNLLSRKIIYGVKKEKIHEAYCNFGITKMIVDYDSSIDEILNSGISCDD